MKEQNLTEGKKRVGECLIEPLGRVGMVKPSNMTVDAFDGYCDDLRARLAYMSAEGLAVLAEVVERNGTGKKGDRFPSVMLVCKMAARIETPPPSDSRLVRWQIRAHGVDALRGGWLVGLYRMLKAAGRPLDDAGLNVARARGKDLRDNVDRARGRDEQGRADGEDLRLIAGVNAQFDRAVALLAEETGRSAADLLALADGVRS
ncbi:MAG: hypothetical protein HWE26_13755 [Alteromonadaceae bacterium]|nr:hypothetical protein [Alteromonadaceae bacterium]